MCKLGRKAPIEIGPLRSWLSAVMAKDSVELADWGVATG